jgi:hypothetical protein
MARISPFYAPIICLLVNAANCDKINAFSPPTKNSGRQSSGTLHNDNFADRVKRGHRTTSASFLYNDNHNEHRPPVFSSVSSTESAWPSTSTESQRSNTSTDERPKIRTLFHEFRSIFGGTVTELPKIHIHDEKEQIHENPKKTYNTDQSQVISLVDIKWLKAHEQVVSEDRVHNLQQSTLEWDAYRLPLLVDSRTGAILDGHHRYAVGCRMGLTRLPVILVDYLDDETIDVDVWPECGIDCLSKEEVIEMSLSENVFPPKTSKHAFVSSFSPIDVPLSKLW